MNEIFLLDNLLSIEEQDIIEEYITDLSANVTDLSDNRIKDIEDAADIANVITGLQIAYEAGKWVSGKFKKWRIVW